MSLALLFGRLLLAAVFLVAGLGKLADTAGSRRAVAGFGVPAWVARPVGTLLPLAELGVAVALVPVSSAWWGAVGAVALLAVFIVAIAVNLALGRSPDCHCFGQVHSAPTGPGTLVRNSLLLGVAVFVLAAGSPDAGASTWGWGAHLPAAEWVAIGAGLVVAGLFAVVFSLLLAMLRQNGRLLLRVEALEGMQAGRAQGPAAGAEAMLTGAAAGLPVGALAPDFGLEGLEGSPVTLSALRDAGRPLLLLFISPGCGPCGALLPEIGRWQREHADLLRPVLISKGSARANRARAGEHGIADVLLQKRREVSDAYRVPGTPSAVLVSPQGTVVAPLAAGPDAIRALLASAIAASPAQAAAQLAVIPPNGNRHATSSPQVPTAVAPGGPAPVFKLPDLAGADVELSDFVGRQILLLFWNPGCGFCQRMLEDLKALETGKGRSQPELVVISRGGVEANEAMGLRSPVLLDDSFMIAQRFGAPGTPSAVLIDPEGRLASPVAIGADAVLELAGHHPGVPHAS